MTDRPGSNGDSTPAGPPLLDQTPSHRLEDQKSVRSESTFSGPAFPDSSGSGDALFDASDVLYETALAALIASDPFADEPLPIMSDAEWARHAAAVADGPADWPSDDDVARLIASMPDDGWPAGGNPRMRAPAGTAPSTGTTTFAGSGPAAGTAIAGRVVFPFPMADAPWADSGQGDPATSLFPGPADLGRVRVIRASVPDLPEAPRPDNPRNVAWSAVIGADALANLDPNNLGENDLLDYVHAANRLAAFAHAMEDAAMAVFATRRPPLASENPTTAVKAFEDASYRSRYADAEIMAVHCVGVGAAHLLLDNAATLANNLPGTTAQYREGLLDSIRIKAILAGLENVPAAVQTVIEPLFLPGASRTNPRALTRKIRKLAEVHNPEPLAVRHERARGDRRVWFTPLPDGMAQISAVLDAVPAKALYDSLDSWARQARHDGTQPGGEPSTGTTPTGRPSRSLDNYLADAFLDLIHQAFLHPAGYCAACGCGNPANCGTGFGNSVNDVHGNGGGNSNSNSNSNSNDHRKNTNGPVPEAWFQPRIPAKIAVLVPALTLLHESDEPGYLEGYGPIPPEQARGLAAGSPWWERVLTDPVTNARLSVGRQHYHPPADIAAEVRRRDPVCTGIGCDHPAATCELDHTVPFWMNRYGPDGTLLPKGETSVENLRPRDLYCHHLKDRPDTGWTVEPDGPGRTKTTTPTGREYIHTQNNDLPDEADPRHENDEPCPF